MNKRDLALLEKCFSAEIDAAVSKSRLPALFQTTSKRMEALEEMGYVKRVTHTLNGRFPVTISGWQLTLLGNFTYCMSGK